MGEAIEAYSKAPPGDKREELKWTLRFLTMRRELTFAQRDRIMDLLDAGEKKEFEGQAAPGKSPDF
jgi:hypothetical protein